MEENKLLASSESEEGSSDKEIDNEEIKDN